MQLRVLFTIATVAFAASAQAELTTTTTAATTMPPSFAPAAGSITLLRTIPPAARQLDSEPIEPMKTSPVHNERRALKDEVQEASLRTVPPLNGPTFAEGTNDRVLTAVEDQSVQHGTESDSNEGVEVLRAITVPPPLVASPVFPLRTSPVHNGRRGLRGALAA